MQTLLHTLIKTVSMLIVYLALQPSVTAAPILTLTTDSVTETVTTGGTAFFKGTITNRTNVDLLTTDLIFNFSDYDPAVFEPMQLLGEIEVNIPSFSFLTDVSLFSINVMPSTLPGRYTFNVLLQDVYGNFDDPLQLEVVVQGGSGNVPEPGIIYLVGLLFAIMVLIRRAGGRDTAIGSN